MAPRQPIHSIGDAFSRSMEPKYRELARAIQRNIDRGMSVNEAVAAATISVNYKFFLSNKIVDSSIKALEAGGIDITIDATGTRKSWLNYHWPKDDLTLSQRTAQLAKLEETKEAIRIALKNQKTWIQTSKALSDADLFKGDIAGHMQDLDRAARRLMAGDQTALKAYQSALAKSKRAISRLNDIGAPSHRVRAAYNDVIKATESMSVKALDKAMANAVHQKARFNAERVARTEHAKAYGQGVYQDVLSDSDVVAIRYDLSSRHDIFDICDFHTGADLFGLGKGIYPLDNLPPYPFHPFCRCVMSNVYRGAVKPFKKGAGADYLKNLSKDKRQALLGVNGSKAFARSGGSWDRNLRNYNGHQSINSLTQNGAIRKAA